MMMQRWSRWCWTAESTWRYTGIAFKSNHDDDGDDCNDDNDNNDDDCGDDNDNNDDAVVMTDVCMDDIRIDKWWYRYGWIDLVDLNMNNSTN
jgi:hypothetical protein